ncbi:DoxX family protein [Actinophytocola sp. NPDC049390]|uniref:DoxX family protein n=1 Tax=Actinophytocola sp. NPDC049390 TaxID=3363894 RepID=UPI0037B2B3E3
MTGLHIALLVAAAAANTFSAVADFLRLERIRVGMARVGVPTRLLPWLGVPKAVAVAGLLAGLARPWFAVAAAAGLVVFFLLAILTHLRVGDRMIGLPLGFLLLAAAVVVTAPV